MPDTGFTPVTSGESLGYVNDDIWVRIDLEDAPILAKELLVIRMLPVDELAVYAGGLNPVYVGGDRLISPRSETLYGYTVPRGLFAGASTLHIRIRTENAVFLEFSLSSSEDLVAENYEIFATYSAVIALLLVYSVWGAVCALRYRDILWLCFSVKGVSLAISMVVHSGMARAFLSSGAMLPLDGYSNISTIAYVFFSQLFECVLLSKLYGRDRIRLLLNFVVGATAVKLALLAGSFVSEALLLNQLTVPLALGVSVWMLRSPTSVSLLPLLRGVRAFYFFQSLPLVAIFAINLTSGALTNSVLESVFVWHGLLSGSFIVVMLSLQARDERRAQLKRRSHARELEIKAGIEAQKSAETADLIYMLAHELKTPLAAMKYASSTGGLTTDRVNLYVSSMIHVLTQCDQVDQIQSGLTRAKCEPIHLGSLIDELLQEWPCEKTSDPLEYNTVVQADYSGLRILLINLLGNAHKYKDEGSSVKIGFGKKTKQWIELRIENTTRGCRDIDVSRLFEKYYRDRSSGRSSGTGLGLYIVDKLSEQSKINVSLCCENGVFVSQVRIPLFLDGEQSDRSVRPETESDEEIA